MTATPFAVVRLMLVSEVKMDLLRKLLGQLAAMNLRQQAKVSSAVPLSGASGSCMRSTRSFGRPC